MIGDTGDFEMANFAQDKKPPRDIITQFGTDFGLEDGWSEEMQGMGFFKPALKMPPRKAATPTRAAPPQYHQAPQTFKPAQRKFGRIGRPFGEFEHPMAGGFEGQMGGWLDDLKAKADAALASAKAQISGQAQTALDKAKADITAQAEAQKTKLIAQAQQTITTQATQLINKATDTATQQLNKGITAAAQSPAVQQAVQTGTIAAVDKLKAAIDEAKKKYGPMVLVGGVAGAGLLAWYLFSKKRG